MNWFKKVFSKNTATEPMHESREDELLNKLESSINQCKNEITKAQEETEQIQKWAIEAIQDSYEVPRKYWYEELKMFQEIKLLDENKTIDSKVIEKCDEVVLGYIEQLKLRKSKTKLYSTLIEKYDATKEKMQAIKSRRDDEIKAQSKLDALEKHSKRLEFMTTNPENLENPVEETNQLDMLKNEANEVFEDFEINEEVRSYLENINHEFESGKYGFNSQSAIDEIEKLANKIKTDKK